MSADMEGEGQTPCPRCGLPHPEDTPCSEDAGQQAEADLELVQTSLEEVSVADATLDSMVQQASVPSLAALIKAGKDRGLIKPQQGYTST